MRTLFKNVLHNLEENLETLNKKPVGKSREVQKRQS